MDTEPYLSIIQLIVINNVYCISSLIPVVVVSLALLVLAAFISGCEDSFFSLTSKDIETLEQKKSRNSKIILTLIRKPDLVFATILTAKILINLIVAILITLYLNFYINGNVWMYIGEFIVLTFLFLYAEEKLFNSYAGKNALRYSIFMATPFNIIKMMLYPLYYFFIYHDSNLNNIIIQKKYRFTLDELGDMLDLQSIPSNDSRIIQGITKFSEIDVKEIMTSRVDVTAVSIEASFVELNNIISESGYSRLPVFEGSFDHIKGILYVKDLWPHLQTDHGKIEWTQFIRPAFFVPETKKINDLLKDFQKKKMHMAIINDEYGGTEGIVTLEDIIEEIVGEISDESDEEELFYSKISDNSYLFQGKLQLNDFFRIVGINDESFDDIEGDSDTLAGLILDIKGEMPHKGELIRYKNFLFKIEAVDKRRIKEIRFTIETISDDANENTGK